MTGAEISALFLLSCVFLGFIWLLYIFIKYVLIQIYLYFTKPWDNKQKDVLKLELPIRNEYEHYLCTYYRVDNVWYIERDSVKHSWDEAKISEPVSTLLTMIYEDYENFNGESRLSGFEHLKLNIYCHGTNLLKLFDVEIQLEGNEYNHIMNFIIGLHDKKSELKNIKQERYMREVRIKNADRLVAEMNKYLTLRR